MDQYLEDEIRKKDDTLPSDLGASFTKGTLDPLISNTEFFGSVPSLGFDLFKYPLDNSFSQTQNLFATSETLQKWSDNTLTYTDTFANKATYAVGMIGTEAAIALMTRGRSLVRHSYKAAKALPEARQALKTTKLYKKIFQPKATSNSLLRAESARNSIYLKKSLASRQQYLETGKIIAGGAFRNAATTSAEHGGLPTEWVKKSSSNYYSPD